MPTPSGGGSSLSHSLCRYSHSADAAFPACQHALLPSWASSWLLIHSHQCCFSFLVSLCVNGDKLDWPGMQGSLIFSHLTGITLPALCCTSSTDTLSQLHPITHPSPASNRQALTWTWQSVDFLTNSRCACEKITVHSGVGKKVCYSKETYPANVYLKHIWDVPVSWAISK